MTKDSDEDCMANENVDVVSNGDGHKEDDRCVRDVHPIMDAIISDGSHGEPPARLGLLSCESVCGRLSIVIRFYTFPAVPMFSTVSLILCIIVIKTYCVNQSGQLVGISFWR